MIGIGVFLTWILTGLCAAQDIVIRYPEQLQGYFLYPETVLQERGIRRVTVTTSVKRPDLPMQSGMSVMVIDYRDGREKKRCRVYGTGAGDSLCTYSVYYNNRLYRRVQETPTGYEVQKWGYPDAHRTRVAMYEVQAVDYLDALSETGRLKEDYTRIVASEGREWTVIKHNDHLRETTYRTEKIRYFVENPDRWITREYRDHAGQEYRRLAYTYNAAGDVERIEWYRPHRQPVSFLFEYGEPGRPTRIEEYSGSRLVRTYELFYGNNGLLRSVLRYPPGEKELEVVEYRYNP